MHVSLSTYLLSMALVGAGVYALTREGSSSETIRVVDVPRPAPADHGAGMPGGGDLTEDDPSEEEPANGQEPAPDEGAAALRWSVPAGWRTLPNTSSMRLATYAIPHAAGDTDDADVSVTRAGGDVASNVTRWAGQFQGAGEPRRVSKTVRGLDVTIVEIEGTYAGGMGPDSKPRPGWALLAAIVKSPGQPYFFKVTGPAATVRAARTAFTALVDSIQPAS